MPKRATSKPTTEQTAFRLPPGMIARLDRQAAKLSKERPGITIVRADVVRMLLTKGLDELEAAS